VIRAPLGDGAPHRSCDVARQSRKSYCYPFSQFIEAAGRTVALDVTIALVRNAAEIEAEIGAAAKRPDGAIIVLPDGLAAVHSALIIGLVNRHRLLALHPYRCLPKKAA
jgi:hypothetical protein